MKNLWRKYRVHLPLAAVLLLYAAGMYFFKISCPIKWLTGISCPGCGMTRAAVALLRLDFAAAFYFHPLVFFLPPLAIALFILHEKGKKRAYAVLLYLLIAAFFAVYLWRMIRGDGAVVTFAPWQSLPARIFRYFRS